MFISCQLHQLNTSTEAVVARGMYWLSPDQSFENLGVVFQGKLSLHFRSVTRVVTGCPGIYPHVFSRALVITCRLFVIRGKGEAQYQKRRSESGRLPGSG